MYKALWHCKILLLERKDALKVKTIPQSRMCLKIKNICVNSIETALCKEEGENALKTKNN